MSEPSFWEKLRRRHVVKVGIAYVVVGTAVGAAAETFLPNLGAPDWVLPTVLGVLVLGLPVALILAWAYELTPVGIVRDAPDGPVPPATASLDEDRKSIVVLPFDNMSPDPNDAYFSDGLTEEIITQLSYLKSLRVISRNSSMVLKNTAKDTRTIGHELNVQYVMEGSVRRAGNDLRITAQLIDAGSDEHLWAETYARELEDVFKVQADIALKVADAMKASLDPRGVRRIEAPPTHNLSSHDAFLLGRHHWERASEDGLSKAKTYFEQALDLDPDYALAHAGLAWWYLGAGAALTLLPPAEALREAKTEAEKAIALDPDMGDAYGTLAWIEGLINWEWEKAQEVATRGVEKDPNSLWAWLCYNYTFGFHGRHDEALAATARYLQLDPLSMITLSNAAGSFVQAGRIDEALQYAIRSEAADSGFWGASSVAWILHCMGEDEEALQNAVKVQSLWPQWQRSSVAWSLAYTLGRAGRQHEFEELANDLERRALEGTTTWAEVAGAYMGVRDHERAFHFLEKAPDQRPPPNHQTARIGVEPLFDPIRDHPRFQTVLKRIGLPTNA